MVRSILGHLLPDAMVCYLENHEVERFAEIFLGEFDTPEAIWSGEMRCCGGVVVLGRFACGSEGLSRLFFKIY